MKAPHMLSCPAYTATLTRQEIVPPCTCGANMIASGVTAAQLRELADRLERRKCAPSRASDWLRRVPLKSLVKP